MSDAKSYVIPKQLVWDAYRRVRANRGAAGVDGETLAAYEKDLKGNLYKVWNRMSSGSYFAPPVRLVEIPKDNGGIRPLGIPTVADRVAQTVVKMVLEPLVEPIFHKDSYGYRPGRSALDAVGMARKRCWDADWVIDLDIRAFFDSIPHGLVERAVAHHTDLPWVRLYIARWLRAPVQKPDGTQEQRTKGTPQGGVISPLLANLFLHYAFDIWMQRSFPSVRFERYADDAIVHCRSEQEAFSDFPYPQQAAKDAILSIMQGVWPPEEVVPGLNRQEVPVIELPKVADQVLSAVVKCQSEDPENLHAVTKERYTVNRLSQLNYNSAVTAYVAVVSDHKASHADAYEFIGLFIEGRKKDEYACFDHRPDGKLNANQTQADSSQWHLLMREDGVEVLGFDDLDGDGQDEVFLSGESVHFGEHEGSVLVARYDGKRVSISYRGAIHTSAMCHLQPDSHTQRISVQDVDGDGKKELIVTKWVWIQTPRKKGEFDGKCKTLRRTVRHELHNLSCRSPKLARG